MFVDYEFRYLDELDIPEEYFKLNGFEEVDRLDVLPHDKLPLRCRYPRVNKWLDSRKRGGPRPGTIDGFIKAQKELYAKRSRYLGRKVARDCVDDDFRYQPNIEDLMLGIYIDEIFQEY